MTRVNQEAAKQGLMHLARSVALKGDQATTKNFMRFYKTFGLFLILNLSIKHI